MDLSNVGEGAVVPGVRVADDDRGGARSPRVEYRRDLGLARHAAPLRTTLRNAPPTLARLAARIFVRPNLHRCGESFEIFHFTYKKILFLNTLNRGSGQKKPYTYLNFKNNDRLYILYT